MKKFMLGCLITGLLILAVIGGAAYWFIWRPSQLQEQAQANARPFVPQAEGLLSKDQVDKYLLVQNAMFSKLGADFERIKKKYEEKLAQPNGQAADVGVSDMLGAYQEFNALRANAKQARTETLNSHKISEEEYAWIRKQVNTSMKIMAVGMLGDAQEVVNIEDLTAMLPADGGAPKNEAEMATQEAMKQAIATANDAIKKASKEAGIELTEAELAAAKKNAELLKPHQAQLLKMAVLSFIDSDNPAEWLTKP